MCGKKAGYRLGANTYPDRIHKAAGDHIKSASKTKPDIDGCRVQRVIPALVVLALCSACTGGGGDNITLTGDSQGVDPVVLEVPVAYIKRPLPESPPDLRDPLGFSPGARLIVKERSSASAEEFDITDKIAAIVAEEEGVAPEEVLLDIKDLESSFDGKTLVFAARGVPEPVAANLELTTWNLWLLDMETLEPSYLIPSRIKRNEGVESGSSQDIAPHFLGDDRIVFSSTRQVASQAQQLNEGRIQIFSALDEDRQDPAAVLHIYDPQQRDSEFTQISFNLSHDLDPVVLSTGEIVFSRWNNTATDHISLFRIKPSGERLSPLYGFHSQDSGTGGSRVEYSQARELDDGRLVSVIRPFASGTLGGAINLLDTANFADIDQPTWDNQGLPGPGQEPLTDTDVSSDGTLSSGGQFASVYPLRDGTGRLLVSWSECRAVDVDGSLVPCTLATADMPPAPPLYGAWVFDPAADTQRPVVIAEEGFMVSEIIAAEPRDFPSLLPRELDYRAELAIEGKGQLLIDSVYDLDGVDASPLGIANHATPGSVAFAARPARFLRIVMPVPIPDDDVFDIPRFASGVRGGSDFREIAGYVPIEPDGSVSATVPADQPFTISVLDFDGRRIGATHNYWLQVAPGEVLHCTGCHNRNSDLPHGRLDSQPVSANPGAVLLADGGTGFPATDSALLFATEPGQTMAETWDFHRPAGDETAAARELELTQHYVDEWTAPTLTAEPDINDRDYDPAWTDIAPDKPIIVDNLDPTLPSRIVINYIDHIQPIWERTRTPVDAGGGVLVDSCIGCHSSQGDSVVAGGQLDLDAVSSDIDPDHYRSYRELLSGDAEQWIDNAGNVSDRLRICTELDADGNTLTFTNTVRVRPTMRAGSANGSAAFFACFEGGACGYGGAPPLPDNCTEDGGVIVPATRNTVDHQGLLSASELRLLSEWLDIGAQYYNNPFDSRLQAAD